MSELDIRTGEDDIPLPCKKCKTMPASGYRCIRCNSLSHPSCVKLLKNVKYIDNFTIICCSENNDAKIKSASVVLSMASHQTGNISPINSCSTQNFTLSDVKSIIETAITPLWHEVVSLRNEIKILRSSNIDLINLLAKDIPKGTNVTTDADNTYSLNIGKEYCNDSEKGKNPKKDKEEWTKVTRRHKNKNRSDNINLLSVEVLEKDTNALSSFGVGNITDKLPSQTQQDKNLKFDNVKLNPAPKRDNFSSEHENSNPKNERNLQSKFSRNNNVLTGARSKIIPLERSCWIYVSNLSPDQTTDDISDVLSELDQDSKFEVEKPPHLNRRETSSAFTIRAPIRFQKTLLDPNFWPANTYVNRYFFSKNKENLPPQTSQVTTI